MSGSSRGAGSQHGALRGGRAAWQGTDAYQSQNVNYEQVALLSALSDSIAVSTAGSPVCGYRILVSESEYTLPLIFTAPLIIKNATGAAATVYAPAGTTIYSTAANQLSIALADGASTFLVKSQNTWYTV
jgi:hypothetical protein